MRHFSHLTHRGLLAIEGDEAKPFLQGLVTVDTARLSPGNPRYAALLTPQGKFLHDFFLLDAGAHLLIDVDRERLPDLLARLQQYRLRAKVRLQAVENLSVFAVFPATALPPAPESVLLIADPRHPPLGARLYGDAAACRAFLQPQRLQEAEEEAYERHRLALGIPDGARDMQAGRSLILECGFEALHGVDFNKGCYVGQEVTARTKFRAHLRKQFYRVSAGAPLPPPGTPVMQDGKAVGELRSHVENAGLALLQNEAVASGVPMSAAGVALRAELPEWSPPPAPEHVDEPADESAGESGTTGL